VPVLVINADPNFDLPAIARQDGLDLFRNERLKLVDVRRVSVELQTERLWGDWPARLEDNRSNLRAEIDRFVATARQEIRKEHIFLFVLDSFDPDENNTKVVNREIFDYINSKAFAKDPRSQDADETRRSHQNVWTVVFLRPTHNAQEAAVRAAQANSAALVNNIFVSNFNGSPTEGPAADFLTIRVLAEILLHETENKRFLQVGTQNAYPATLVSGPDDPPNESVSRNLRWALRQTLTELEKLNAPTAGSEAISNQAEELRKLVENLVDQIKTSVTPPPTIDVNRPDRVVADIQRSADTAHQGGGAPSRYETAVDEIVARFTRRHMTKIHWRPDDDFSQLRKDLREHIAGEHHDMQRMHDQWDSVRPEQLKTFGGVNVEITKAIASLSQAAVGSRGNDVKILEDLIAMVRRRAEGLKSNAQAARDAMTNVSLAAEPGSGAMTEIELRLNAFEDELKQAPQWRAIGFVLALSFAAAILAYLPQLLRTGVLYPLHVALLVGIFVLILVLTAVALIRRKGKLRQMTVNLRTALEKWRSVKANLLNKAMIYQINTLAVGWLDAAAGRLDRIKTSIRDRDHALRACRHDLGANEYTDKSVEDGNSIVTNAVQELRTASWDRWIIEFLAIPRFRDSSQQAEIKLLDDGYSTTVAVPGLLQRIIVTFKTPPRVAEAAALIGTAASSGAAAAEPAKAGGAPA
jgi:hypothetical protein